MIQLNATEAILNEFNSFYVLLTEPFGNCLVVRNLTFHLNTARYIFSFKKFGASDEGVSIPLCTFFSLRYRIFFFFLFQEKIQF